MEILDRNNYDVKIIKNQYGYYAVVLVFPMHEVHHKMGVDNFMYLQNDGLLEYEMKGIGSWFKSLRLALVGLGDFLQAFSYVKVNKLEIN